MLREFITTRPVLQEMLKGVQIGRAHVWNSSHLVISYAVFCLKKKDPLHQHDLARTGAVLSGRRGDEATDPPAHPLERGRDGRPRKPPLRGHWRDTRTVSLAR